MTRPPYNAAARRVFWIVDNSSSHRGVRAAQCLRDRYRRLTLVHAPIQASWLNQIEIYFSIIQRKVLTPNDFTDLNALSERLLDFPVLLADDGPSLPMEVHASGPWEIPLATQHPKLRKIRQRTSEVTDLVRRPL